MKKAFKKGFTLAEVMIVLTVIGVLAGILIPVANNARPDEKVMKFKKAHATLANVIHELVTSDKYYANGDLGVRADGSLIDSSNDTNIKFFCNSFADIISAKKINCSTVKNGNTHANGNGPSVNPAACSYSPYDDVSTRKTGLDKVCKETTNAGEEIVASDNVVYYQTSPYHTFGTRWVPTDSTSGNVMEWFYNLNWRLFGCIRPDDGGTCFNETYDISKGGTVDRLYKLFCIDIDGIPAGGSENCDDIKDICPFGYGIRADGKILSGARADVWLEKGFQKGKNDN